MPHAQRQLDRRVAFLARDRGVGAVAQEQVDHRRVALHGGIGEGRIAVFVHQVRVEVHRQHLLRIDEVVLLDRVEERAHAFRALLARLRFESGRQQLHQVVDHADADQRDERQHDRRTRDVEALGDLLGHVGARDEQHHHDEQAGLEVQEQADDHAAGEDREQRGVRDAERFFDVFVRQVGRHRGDRDEAHQDELAHAQLRQKIELFFPFGHRFLPFVLAVILRVCARVFKLKFGHVEGLREG